MKISVSTSQKLKSESASQFSKDVLAFCNRTFQIRGQKNLTRTVDDLVGRTLPALSVNAQTIRKLYAFARENAWDINAYVPKEGSSCIMISNPKFDGGENAELEPADIVSISVTELIPVVDITYMANKIRKPGRPE